MISKILKLTGVGTLHAPLPSGGMTLKAKTIIYGENGRGKTTLVAVLRSMACGDTAALRQRKTINGTNPQAAQFLVGTQSYELTSNAWTKIHPEICVFDATFISENVYSGAIVDPDQRKNLLSFAVGSQGVSLARKVDDLAAQITEKRTEETKAADQVRKFISGEITPEQFARLSAADPGAQLDLNAAKKTRDAVARSSTILELETPNPISFEGLNRHRLSQLLLETFEEVSTDAAKLVHDHIASAGVTETWLEEGSRFETGDRCPYCAQNTLGLALVEAYKLSFDEAYKAFKAKLRRELTALLLPISPDAWASVKTAIDGNRTKMVPWRDFLGKVELPFDLKAHTAIVQKASAAARAIIDRKLAAPLEAQMAAGDELAALEMLETTITAIDDYNAAQVSLNEKIANLKRSVSGVDLKSAEATVHEIENRIARGTPSAEAASKALLNTIAAKKQLELDKDNARSALDAHMKTVVSQYKDSINKHLKGCGTGFQIKELKTVYTGAKPRFDYVIELFGIPVDLTNKSSSAVVFDSALSLGDKGALAFAFFLAKLENDPKRGQQTVVFDDPLSSLDSCRRRYTRQQIARLAPEVAQLIVLTHEESTVADISNRLQESECAIFELRPQGNFSVFTKTTVKEITASDYSRCFDALNHYQFGIGKPEEVVGRVRPYLEMNLRYRFPEEFGPDHSLGKMIGQIRSCDASKPLSKMKSLLATLEGINEYTTDHIHGDKALVNAEKMLASDLKTIVCEALNLGRGLPH